VEQIVSEGFRTELNVAKGIEMVAESIPASLLQLYVLVKEGGYSTRTVGSVVISAMTTGFSGASMS